MAPDAAAALAATIAGSGASSGKGAAGGGSGGRALEVGCNRVTGTGSLVRRSTAGSITGTQPLPMSAGSGSA